MAHHRNSRRRGIIIATAMLSTAALGVGAGPAHASPAVPDLPVATRACKVDTGPNWPSCLSGLRLVGGSGGTSAIVIGTGWACAGGGDEPVHCKPVFIGCTDNQEQCASTG